MKGDLITWALGVLATVLSGMKFYDLFYPAATGKRLDAEAKIAMLEARKAELDLRQDEAGGVQDQCDRLLKQMIEMQGKLQHYMMEVAELKAQCTMKDAAIDRLEKENGFLKSENKRLLAVIEKGKGL